MDNNDAIIDYIAWGGDAGADDDAAVAASEWPTGEYINTSELKSYETIGRDKLSSDSNRTIDWENFVTEKADPYGTDATIVTPCAQNSNRRIVINEVMFNPSNHPFDNGWEYRKEITINSSKIMDNLTNFPVLIEITDADLIEKARLDGFDILFCAADGETQLDFELEGYDGSTGSLTAWVKIPILNATNDTVIYMYYGKPYTTEPQNSEGVWSNDYVGVYHMTEDFGSIQNSVADSNHGGRYNTPTRTSGQINFAQQFSGNGDGDTFRIKDLGLADGINSNITFSAWASIDDADSEDYGKVLANRNGTSGNYTYSIQVDDQSPKRVYIQVNDDNSPRFNFVENTWLYIVGTYNGTQKRIYINGQMLDIDYQSGPIEKSLEDTFIGSRLSGQDIGGMIDEIRFSSVARSDAWIETEYNNQNDTSTFFVVGSEMINTNDWFYRKVITINSSQVPANQTDYPLLINHQDIDLKNKARSDGNDILFTAADGGTILDFEIERFNKSSGDITAWVRIPNLSATTDTIIHMYYGNPEITSSYANPIGVWDDNFKLVQHFQEYSGTCYDSTQYYNNGTPENGVTQSFTGKIDTSARFTSGVERVTVPDSNSLDFTSKITISAWINKTGAVGFQSIVNKGEQASGVNYFLDTFNDELAFGFYTGGSWYENITTGLNLQTGVWYYVMATFDDANNKVKLYINGSLISEFDNFFSPSTNGFDLGIGLNMLDTEAYMGNIDEVRVSDTVRSAERFTTEFNNQNSTNTFYSISEELITSNWLFRKPITINSSYVTSDLTDFPILIDITDFDLKRKARLDGFDISFTSADGKTCLDHEIEEFDGSTGEWHLNENGDGTVDEFSDSTKYNNNGWGGDGNINNVPSKTIGRISYGQDFNASSGDGIPDFINCSNDASLDITGKELTIEAWINFHGPYTDHYSGILSKGGWSAGYRPIIRENSYNVKFQLPENTYDLGASQSINADSWHHVVMVYNGSKMMMYIDGVKDTIELAKSDNILLAPDNLWLGHGDDVASAGWSYPWNGLLDEVRISDVARSTDWIQTQYNNQNSSKTFISAGLEESIDHEWVELYNPGTASIDLTGWYLTDNDGNRFELSGGGTLLPGKYIVCHLGESGRNGSGDIFGPVESIVQTTVQLGKTDGKDTFLDNGNPTTNYGVSSRLYMNQYNDPIQGNRPMVQFNLSDFENKTITNAQIWLYRYDGSTNVDGTVRVYRVTRDWTESGATYNTYDGSNAWTTSGGDYNNTPYDTQTVYVSINRWYNWDITELVQSWLAGTYQNYGMIFVAEYYSSWEEFRSMNYTGDPTMRPMMTISYYDYSQKNILDNSDDLTLVNYNDMIYDYVAWGSDAGTDDDTAVAYGQWIDGAYVDTSDFIAGETLGRDKYSTDTDTPIDWENESNTRGDPFGVNSTCETPSAKNEYPFIPEFDIIAIPILIITVIILYFNKNRNLLKYHKEKSGKKKSQKMIKKKR
jgi:hypothetical protein